MKHIIMKLVLGSFLLLAVCLASSCQKQINQNVEQAGPVFDLTLNFKAVVDAVPLEYNKIYNNYFQEP